MVIIIRKAFGLCNGCAGWKSGKTSAGGGSVCKFLIPIHVR